MTIWLTADTHFGHESIIKFCARPFDSVEEMNRTLIDNIIGLVSKNDTLYVIGDFAWNQRLAKEIAHELAFYCDDIRYLCGNHDKTTFTKNHAELVRHNKRKYFLSHYPLATLAPQISNVHGHCHGTYHEQPWQVDVGVDAVGYAPVSMEWVAQKTVPFSRKDENVLAQAIMAKFGTTQQEKR